MGSDPGRQRQQVLATLRKLRSDLLELDQDWRGDEQAATKAERWKALESRVRQVGEDCMTLSHWARTRNEYIRQQLARRRDGER